MSMFYDLQYSVSPCLILITKKAFVRLHVMTQGWMNSVPAHVMVFKSGN